MPPDETLFDHYCDIIPEFPLFQKGIQRPLPTHVRVNRLMIEPEVLVRFLEMKGMDVRLSCEGYDTLYHIADLESPGNLLEYFLGYIHPQALTSCLAACALSPRKDSYVLDMCAAPGGKTSHMAQVMDNTGMIVANELYRNRHIPLGHTLDRMGVLNTIITGYQAQEFPLRDGFDYVLADVPCSGEGRFRKTEPSLSFRPPKDKMRLPELQKKIIVRGFDLLKKGGEMLYATCTYNPEENESVVNFLLGRRDAELLDIELGLDCEPGLIEWKDETFDEHLKKGVRFYPHRFDSVGFFMAKIGKKG